MKYLIVLLLISVSGQASDIWDIAKGKMLKSENELPYLESDLITPKAGYLVDPDRTAVRTFVLNARGNPVYTNTTPPKYWKPVGNALVPMTQTEKDKVDAGRATKANEHVARVKELKLMQKGTRLAAIAALRTNGIITQTDHDARVAEVLE